MPTTPEQIFIANVFTYLDLFFTIAFSCECVVKIVSFGFVMDKGSYLRDNWSQLDFFIVVVSIVDASLVGTSLNLSFIKILRLMRTLRPLRFISHNVSMKLMVTALMESVTGIFNVVIVIFMVWLMFAILAITLKKGQLNMCVSQPVPSWELY